MYVVIALKDGFPAAMWQTEHVLDEVVGYLEKRVGTVSIAWESWNAGLLGEAMLAELDVGG
jgi:hypothetical protein